MLWPASLFALPAINGLPFVLFKRPAGVPAAVCAGANAGATSAGCMLAFTNTAENPSWPNAATCTGACDLPTSLGLATGAATVGVAGARGAAPRAAGGRRRRRRGRSQPGRCGAGRRRRLNVAAQVPAEAQPGGRHEFGVED